MDAQQRGFVACLIRSPSSLAPSCSMRWRLSKAARSRNRCRCASVSNLEAHAIVQLELPLGLADEGRRPGTKKGVARSRADRAVDAIRKRFGGQAVDYGQYRGLCAPSLTSSDALLKESFDYRPRS